MSAGHGNLRGSSEAYSLDDTSGFLRTIRLDMSLQAAPCTFYARPVSLQVFFASHLPRNLVLGPSTSVIKRSIVASGGDTGDAGSADTRDRTATRVGRAGGETGENGVLSGL